MPSTPSMNRHCWMTELDTSRYDKKYDGWIIASHKVMRWSLKDSYILIESSFKQSNYKDNNELWMGRKPNLKHLHIWGCPAQAQLYIPKDRKLDSRTISCYFVGFSKKSWGFKFCDSSTRGILGAGNAHFFEDIKFDGGNKVRDTDFQEEHDDSVYAEGNQILSCV